MAAIYLTIAATIVTTAVGVAAIINAVHVNRVKHGEEPPRHRAKAA